MFEIEIARKRCQLVLEMREVDRAHLGWINPAPDDMRMPPSFFLVIDNCARLPRQAERQFRRIRRSLEIPLRDIGGLGRIDAEREQILLAARPAGDGLRFLECAVQIVRCKAAHFADTNMIIVAIIEQMRGELRAASAL